MDGGLAHRRVLDHTDLDPHLTGHGINPLHPVIACVGHPQHAAITAEGHALGATMATIVMAMILPPTIALMTGEQAQGFYISGFKIAALMVVAVMLTGAVINMFHKALPQATGSAPPRASSPQPGGASGDS